MDKVFLQELRVNTVIGVFEWERQVRQTVCFDVEMAHDITRAAQTDDLQYALDYSAVARRIGEFAESSAFLLVEKLAEEVAALIMREFGVPWLRLSLYKPGALPEARSVGVTIERGCLP